MANPNYGVDVRGDPHPLVIDKQGKLKLSIEWIMYIIMIVNFIQVIGIAAILYTVMR